LEARHDLKEVDPVGLASRADPGSLAGNFVALVFIWSKSTDSF
jgi:hypothetical protein